MRISTFLKDGYLGLPEYAPFDKILVTAAAPEIPKTLLEQLSVGGLLVIPVGGSEGQKMLRIKKTAPGKFEKEVLDNFRFVPFTKGINRTHS